MQKRGLTFGLVFLVSLAVAFPTLALPPEVEKSLHEIEILRLEEGRNLDQIWKLRQNPNLAEIIDVNFVEREHFESAQVQILKDWVRNGHTLICYPANSSMLREFDVETADLDLPSTATQIQKVKAAGPHPVLTGVEDIRLYLNEAVSANYDVPLLRYKDNTVAALKDYGSGLLMIVNYHAIERREQYRDNERFLVNLREFAAGYPVPGTRPTRTDKITLSSEKTLKGEIEPLNFEFRTPYGRFSFSQKEIASINLQQGVLRLERGDKLIGELLISTVHIQLQSGNWRTIDTRKIITLSFAE